MVNDSDHAVPRGPSEQSQPQGSEGLSEPSQTEDDSSVNCPAPDGQAQAESFEETDESQNLTEDEGYLAAEDGYADAQDADEGYAAAEDVYADGQDADEGYAAAEDGYADAQDADEGYAAAEDGYPDAQDADEGYAAAEDVYADGQDADEGYAPAEDVYADGQDADEGYAAAEDGYADAQDADEGYAAAEDDLGSSGVQNDDFAPTDRADLSESGDSSIASGDRESTPDTRDAGVTEEAFLADLLAADFSDPVSTELADLPSVDASTEAASKDTVLYRTTELIDVNVIEDDDFGYDAPASLADPQAANLNAPEATPDSETTASETYEDDDFGYDAPASLGDPQAANLNAPEATPDSETTASETYEDDDFGYDAPASLGDPEAFPAAPTGAGLDSSSPAPAAPEASVLAETTVYEAVTEGTVQSTNLDGQPDKFIESMIDVAANPAEPIAPTTVDFESGGVSPEGLAQAVVDSEPAASTFLNDGDTHFDIQPTSLLGLTSFESAAAECDPVAAQEETAVHDSLPLAEQSQRSRATQTFPAPVSFPTDSQDSVELATIIGSVEEQQDRPPAKLKAKRIDRDSSRRRGSSDGMMRPGQIRKNALDDMFRRAAELKNDE